MSVWFYNTFNLVVPLLEELLPVLETRGVPARAYVCRSEYRAVGERQLPACFRRIEVPGPFLRSKLGVHAYYFAAATFHVLFSRSRLDVFFTQPPFFFIFGSWLSRLRSRPYAVHVMDVHPDLMGRLGILSEDGLAFRILSYFAVRALRRADFVIAIGACMQELLVRKGVSPEKVHLVRNLPAVPAHSLPTVSSGPDEKGVFRVLYAGNMGRPHDFSAVLEAAGRLRGEQPSIRFVFVGGGARRGEVEEAVRSQDLSNVEISPPLDAGAFREVLARADLHLVTLRDGFEGLVVPSKYYSSVAVGKPVIFIGPEDSEVARDITRNGWGAVVPNGNVVLLVDTILRFSAAVGHRAEDEKRIASEFAESYQRSSIVGSYVDIIEKTLK